MPTKSSANLPEDKKTPAKSKGAGKLTNRPFLYVFSVVILVIIVVTFLGAPVIGGIGQTGRIIFGYYKKKPIEYVPGNYFSRQKDLIGEQIRSTGDKNENIEYQVYQVWRGAFDRTVFQTAIVTAMEESGAHVSESLIDEALTRYPGYLENGEFSERRYSQTSSSEKFLIRRSTRDGLLFDKHLQDLFSIRTSSKDVEFFKKMSSPERKFKFVDFSFSEFPEDQIVAYGMANTEKFTRMKVSIISITSGKADAEKILERAVSKTESFEDLAKAHSKDPYAEKNGDMGWQYFYELEGIMKSQADIKKIFALKKGEIASLVEGPGSWMIFRCDEAAVTPDFTSPEVQKIIRTYMSSFERGKIEDYVLNEAKKFREQTGTKSFEAVAAARGLKVQETGFFPINFGNSIFLKPVTQNNDALGNAPFREVFFSIAFSLKQNEVSEPIVLRDNVVVLNFIQEQNAEENNLAFLDMYFPYILQQFQEENLQQFVMNTKNLQDNFNEVFMQYFIPKNE
jgi:hypothetical protein